MGKKSLLESTSGKKTGAKKSTAKRRIAKKTAPKSSAKTPKKAAGKKPAAKTASAKSTPKSQAVKAKKTPTAKKAPVRKTEVKTAAKTKPTLKELLFKKFDHDETRPVWKPPKVAASAGAYDAPSFFAGMSEADAKRGKALLMAKFDYAEIKAAGDKAAVETAAAERTVAEKTAADKAVAEKAAAESAAADKAVSPPKPPEPTAPTPPSPAIAVPPDAPEPGSKFLRNGVIAVAAVIFMLLVYSYANTRNYYIIEKDGAVEIQQGSFAPMGEDRLITLTGVPAPETPKDVYSRQEAYTLIYTYYINRADALLDAPRTPDTAALKDNLELAVEYAPDRERMDAAKSRLVSLNLQLEIQKASAAINRRTIESVQKGIDILRSAKTMGLSEAEAAMVDSRIASAEALLVTLEAEKAEADRLAAEQSALEAEKENLGDAAETAAPPVTDKGGK